VKQQAQSLMRPKTKIMQLKAMSESQKFLERLLVETILLRARRTRLENEVDMACIAAMLVFAELNRKSVSAADDGDRSTRESETVDSKHTSTVMSEEGKSQSDGQSVRGTDSPKHISDCHIKKAVQARQKQVRACDTEGTNSLSQWLKDEGHQDEKVSDLERVNKSKSVD